MNPSSTLLFEIPSSRESKWCFLEKFKPYHPTPYITVTTIKTHRHKLLRKKLLECLLMLMLIPKYYSLPRKESSINHCCLPRRELKKTRIRTQSVASILHKVPLAFVVGCHQKRNANPPMKSICYLVEKGKEHDRTPVRCKYNLV